MAANTPAFDFATDPTVVPFTVPPQTYLSTRSTSKLDFEAIATGALVFDGPRILLVQRSASDSMPNLWETPGGACDPEDVSILHGAARELWEEAGLTAVRVGPLVGEGYLFATRAGKRVCKFNFVVEVEEGKREVKLDADEHQAYVWATEEEVREKRVGELKFEFTKKRQEEVILQAFKMRKEKEEAS